MPTNQPRPNVHQQRGVAIITALLVVMLAATIAAYLLAQQSRALTRMARATERAQVLLYAQPTLDWARAVLFESRNDAYVHTRQAWAQPIAAQPLLAANNTSNVFAAGFIRDEAAKFNLNNLVFKGVASVEDIEIFRQLLKQLKLNPDLCDAVVDWLDTDSEARANGAEDGYYLSLAAPYRTANRPMVQWQELARVRGFDAAVMQRLAPFVTALPPDAKTSSTSRSKININTAPLALIQALFPEITGDDAVELVRLRELPFLNRDDLLSRKPALKKALTNFDQFADVKSRHFLVSLAITGENAAVHQTVLLERVETNPASWPRIIWVQTQ